MDYVVAVLLPQLLHGLVFGAALGLLALGLTVIFGLLGVMNFAHGELFMMGAYAGIAVIGLTQSFWVALILAPLMIGVLGAVTEVATIRPIYRREPLYGLILTFGLALDFREGGELPNKWIGCGEFLLADRGEVLRVVAEVPVVMVE